MAPEAIALHSSLLTLEACAQSFFDYLQCPGTQLPSNRFSFLQFQSCPFFKFSPVQLTVQPSLKTVLISSHLRTPTGTPFLTPSSQTLSHAQTGLDLAVDQCHSSSHQTLPEGATNYPFHLGTPRGLGMGAMAHQAPALTGPLDWGQS